MMENNDNNIVQNEESAEEQYTLDPTVEKLLDAKDYTEKLKYLDLLRNNCDSHILSIIAISHDIELIDGTVEDQYAQVLKHFRMHEKYETSRDRLRG